MKKIYFVLLSASLLLLSGCATVTSDIKVDAEVAPNATLDRYKTYDWLGAFTALNDPNKTWQPPNIDIVSDVKFLVDRELRKRDIYSTSNTPDLVATFFIGVDMENKTLQLDPDTKIELNKTIPKAALVVVLIDVASKEIVWLGEANGDIQKNATPEIARERLDYAVREMFKLMP